MDGLRGAHQEVEAAGGKALILHTDVADPAQVERAAEAVENRFGPIDIWINNAMTSVFSPVKEMQAEEYQRVTNVTYLGAVYGTLSALRRMLPRNRGTIVQVGSALASRSIPLQSAYCAAKHAMAGFTDSLRCELLHDNSKVRLTMVQLPAMNTPQFGWVKSRLTHKAQPVPPIFQPEVGARGIYWAAHHAPRELLIGGPTVEAVEGNKFFPGLADTILHGPATSRSRPRSRKTRTVPTTCGSRSQEIMARTARSATALAISATNYGPQPTRDCWLPYSVRHSRWLRLACWSGANVRSKERLRSNSQRE
jgi:NAD(P)-dependent dehydrogenase (short-subunit alcohol dehydrogenase family)